MLGKRRYTLRGRKAAITPSVVDLAWAAGFLEGEGSFCVTKRPPFYIYPYIQVAQVQKEPLERLQKMFGGSFHLRTEVTRPKQHPYWRWSVSGARALGVMLTLFSFMSPKRKQQITSVLNA